MTHHGAALRALVNDDVLVLTLARDWHTAGLSGADAALCAFAEALTRSPATMRESDIEALRREGFDDRGILDACQVVAYFNFVTRIALGLGVELEPYWRREEIVLPQDTSEPD
jgi:uncharacterized peroxidase-related enzyme